MSDAPDRPPRDAEGKADPPPAKKPVRPGPSNLLWLALAGACAFGLIALLTGGRGGTEMTVSRFRALVEDGTIRDETAQDLRVGRDAITFAAPPGLVPSPDADAKGDGERAVAAGAEEPQLDADGEPVRASYRVPVYSLPDALFSAVLAELDEKEVTYGGAEPPPEWAGLAILFLPVLVLFGLLIFVLRKFGGPGAAMSFGKSRGRLAAQDDVEVTFADVAGIDEAKEELMEVVDFLKTPQKYQALGGRIPRGVLLVGPPGTGKTLLAKAVAGEAGVSFFSLSGSDFVEMFVGVGAARVRDMFKQAAEKERAIIFIDELDALGKARGNGAPGGHEEREQTLNALLVEMDGFDSGQSVIVMGATNRPETLDPALLRPGRFDRTVTVDRPDKAGRRAILEVHSRKVTLATGEKAVDLDRLAGITPGFVGADLANLMNEAALLAARAGKQAVTMTELEEAIERVVAGLEKGTRLIHDDEKERVSYHECGHALVACSLPHTDPVHKISIIPRGMGLGYTLHFPADERMLTTRTELFNKICCFLGGIAAEDLIYEEASTGAQNDLQRSTDIARRMVTEFGMSDRLGRVHYSDARSSFLGPQASGDTFHAEQTLRQIDLEVKSIIDRAGTTAAEILAARRPLLDKMAKELLEVEVMDAAHLKRLLDEDTTGPRLSLGTKRGGKKGEVGPPAEIDLPTPAEATDPDDGIEVA